MRAMLLVAGAGAAGAVARYAVALAAERTWGGHFAFGTLLVNVLGCLALGFLLEVERGSDLVTHSVRLLVAVGFLGAFTTFSTFGYETLRYVQDGSPHLALLNVAANLTLGLLAVWLGVGLARAVVGVA
jgi:CrcB protein